MEYFDLYLYVDNVLDLLFMALLLIVCRPVSDADIQNLDKRLMQTMDMIIMKKKRSVLCSAETLVTFTRQLLQFCFSFRTSVPDSFRIFSAS